MHRNRWNGLSSPTRPSSTSRSSTTPEGENDEDHLPLPFWQPPTGTAIKLMATGASVGTVVDSLHNQILLEYHVAPVQIMSPMTQSTAQLSTSISMSTAASPLTSHASNSGIWLATSWTVPPLLAVAYLLLGAVLPRIIQKVITSVVVAGNDSSSESTTTARAATTTATTTTATKITTLLRNENDDNTTAHESSQSLSPSPSIQDLRHRALWAVATTAMIVKLSDSLERHPGFTLPPSVFDHCTTIVNPPPTPLSSVTAWLDVQHLIVLFGAAVLQWWALDRTPVAFVLATIAAYGGPLGKCDATILGFPVMHPRSLPFFSVFSPRRRRNESDFFFFSTNGTSRIALRGRRRVDVPARRGPLLSVAGCG